MLLATLMAAQIQSQDGLSALQNRSFSISGFFCEGVGCEANPRRLGPSLRFAVGTQEYVFDGAEHLKPGWGVRLDCAIAGDRLKRCRVVDQPAGVTTGVTIALRLVRRARLRKTADAGSRAIVDIDYEPGDCPPWYCVPTPPPPPPPPAK